MIELLSATSVDGEVIIPRSRWLVHSLVANIALRVRCSAQMRAAFRCCTYHSFTKGWKRRAGGALLSGSLVLHLRVSAGDQL